jgi:hypothetical protein
LSDLYKIGELSVALAICVVVLLIIKALVPVMMRPREHASGNGVEARLKTAEAEIKNLREWRHSITNEVSTLKMREELWRISSQNPSRQGGKGP